MNTLMAVTGPVPRRRMIFSLKKLEIMVPPAIIMEMMPAKETGT